MAGPDASASVALRPFAAAAIVHGISVRVSRPSPAQPLLEYELQADRAQLRIAPPADARATQVPTDGLWRHTCMELFVSPSRSGPYLEFNFAPSGQWAAYRFSGYRADMAPLSGLRPPRIELRTQARQLLLSADVALPEPLGAAALYLGLTAVVEDAAGHHSYWALSHVGERPDFHQPESFGFEI